MNEMEEVFKDAIEKSDKCGQCGVITARIGGDSQSHWCCNCGAKLRGNHPYSTIANIPPRIWDDEKRQYEYLKMPLPAEVPMPKPDRVTQIGDKPRFYSHSADQLRKYGAACRAAGEAAGYARGLREMFDCRTCRNYTRDGCIQTARCVDGDGYRRAAPVRFWSAALWGR